MSALTVLALFRVPRKAGVTALTCAGLFIALSLWMITSAVIRSPRDLLWVGAVAVLATIGYVATPRRKA
jgi:hypothetical protein